MQMTIRPKPPRRFLLRRVLDLSLSYRHHAVIIAVSLMGKMQMSIHEKIRMVAMRHGFVPAIRAMGMRRLVAFTDMRRRTGLRVLRRDRKYVLVDMVIMRMVHVSVVQKVGVAVMLNPGVAAGVIMNMDVWGMREVTHRDLL